MSVKGMAIVLAVLFCTTIVQGFPMFRRGRCLCVGSGLNTVKMADVKEASIIFPSGSCDKIEVIVTLKAQKEQQCLNPRSRQASRIIKQIQRKHLLKHLNV